MKNRLPVLALAAALLLFAPPPASAQETQPGDACTAGELHHMRQSSGPENPGTGYFLVCDGANWRLITEWDTATGNSLFQVDYDPGACDALKEARLRYTSASKLWEYCDGATWSSLGSASAAALNDLSDVSVLSAADQEVLTYDSASGTWASAPTGLSEINALGDIADVNVPAPGVGEVLEWNGSAWVAATDDGGTSIWSDTGSGYIEYSVAGAGVKINSVAATGVQMFGLDALDDVSAPAPLDNQVLTYNSASGNWIAANTQADNLGNHKATQNIELDGNWLSGDGGSEGIFVDAAGNVGIGTASPGYKLHVDGGSDTALASGGYIVAGSTTGANISIDSDEIMARNNGAASTLRLNNNGGSVFIGASMTVNATSTINGGLNVNSPDNSGGLKIISATAGTTRLPHSDNWNYISGNGIIIRNTADAEKFRFDAVNGRLGIGTASPNTELQVSGSVRLTSIGDAYQLVNANHGLRRAAVTGGSDQDVELYTAGATGDIVLSTGGAGAAKLVIKPSGNVGIGTTAPTSKLDVRHDFNGLLAGTADLSHLAQVLRYNANATGEGVGLGFSVSSDPQSLGAKIVHIREGNWSDGSLAFFTGHTTIAAGDHTSERMRIDANGNVGIGTTSPSAKLDVVGDVEINGNLTVTGTLPGDNLGNHTATQNISLGANDITGTNRLTIDGSLASGVYDDATSNAPYSQISVDSLHTNGMGVGQMWIEGGAMDANSTILIGTGVAGGQAARDVTLGDNNELFVDTSANFVGIGTGSPSAALDVVGTTELNGMVTITNDVEIARASPQIKFDDTTAGAVDFWTHVNGDIFYVLADRDESGGWETPHPLALNASTNVATIFGNTAWHAGNDGAGSGLAADTLDGLSSAQFLRADVADTGTDLTLTSLSFPNTAADKIKLYSNTYGIGIEGSTLTNWSNANHRWRIGGTSASTGTQYMILNNTGLTVTGKIDASTQFLGQAADSVTAPSFAWTGDTDTGLYRAGANTVAITTAGVQRALINGSGLTVAGDLTVGNITATSLTTSAASEILLEGGVSRISHNDGGGNFLIRMGNEYSGGHIFTHGGGAALITSNIDATSNTKLNFQVASNPGSGTGTAVTWGPALSLSATDLTFTGNVGIGTDVPLAPLTVVGLVESASWPFNAYYHDKSSTAIDNGAGIGLGGKVDGTNNVWMFGGIHGGKENATSGNYKGYLSLHTRDNSTTQSEKVRITSAGNVGIGTASPSYPLSVYKAGNADISIDTNSGASTNLRLNSDTWSTINSAAKLGIIVGGTERVRILNTNGNVGIGETVPSRVLHIKSAVPVIRLEDSNAATDAEVVAHVEFYRGGVRTGYVGDAAAGNTEIRLVSDLGNIRLMANTAGAGVLIDAPTNCWLGTGTGATNCTSDRRLKQNIVPLSGALAKIMQLEGVNYEWKTSPGERRLGVIAQDIQEVFPEAVIEDEEGYLGVSHGVLVAPLIEAVKELKAEKDDEVEALKADNATMRAENAALKGSIKALENAVERLDAGFEKLQEEQAETRLREAGKDARILTLRAELNASHAAVQDAMVAVQPLLELKRDYQRLTEAYAEDRQELVAMLAEVRDIRARQGGACGLETPDFEPLKRLQGAGPPQEAWPGAFRPAGLSGREPGAGAAP